MDTWATACAARVPPPPPQGTTSASSPACSTPSAPCIDRDRVFATGFSMGGYFSHHLGCAGPPVIRAIAPHSGGTYPGDCDDAPMPVMILHGDADPLISPSCGEAAAQEWLRRDGCPAGAPLEVPVAGGTCAVVTGCTDGSSVTWCSFEGMDHGWAGSDDWLYGGGTRYEDAAELAWSFFAGF
ncbi:MAG: hypothetical protein R3F59_13075 [Myxococcota bacterium]